MPRCVNMEESVGPSPTNRLRLWVGDVMKKMFAADGDAVGDTFGGRLSLAREALSITVPEAALSLGVKAHAWEHWESDRCQPPPAMLYAVAHCLEVSLYWLLTGRGHGPQWQDLFEINCTPLPRALHSPDAKASASRLSIFPTKLVD